MERIVKVYCTPAEQEALAQRYHPLARYDAFMLLQLDAGPDHLRELREIIYPSLKPERPAALPAAASFAALGSESIGYSLDLCGGEPIADLLAMTPHLYRANAERRALAAQLTALSVSVDVRLSCFRRQASR